MPKIIKKNTKNRYQKGGKGKPKLKGKPKTQQFITGIEQMFDKKQILDKQNKLRKLYESVKRDPNANIQNYDKIKYQEIIYQKGQYIQIHSYQSHICYIARLSDIIKVSSQLEPRAFLEVEWVMKKDDLPEHILNNYGKLLSTAQVFPSSDKIYLYVESIKSKCTVLPIEQYSQLGITTEFIYFTRANYDPITKSLKPQPELWKSDCYVCRLPNNPDLQYCSCGKCERWFHTECVSSQIINEHFLCQSCFTGQIPFQS